MRGVGYSMNILQQSAFLVLHLVMILVTGSSLIVG